MTSFTNQSKNSTSATNQTKSSTTFTKQSKNSTTNTNQAKNSTTFSNISRVTNYLWASTTFPWLSDYPWQLTGVSGNFDLQTKN